MLDSEQYPPEFGIRSLINAHGKQPFTFEHGGQRHEVADAPGALPLRAPS